MFKIPLESLMGVKKVFKINVTLKHFLLPTFSLILNRLNNITTGRYVVCLRSYNPSKNQIPHQTYRIRNAEERMRIFLGS